MVKEKPFRDSMPWTDFERMIVILAPREQTDKIAELLARTPDAVKMKRDVLMHLYADRYEIGETGLITHSNDDEIFVGRGWCEISREEFQVNALRRCLNNLKKEVGVSSFGGGKSLRRAWSAEEIEKTLKVEEEKDKAKKKSLKDAFA